jgi:hypothetical protein
LTDPLRDIAARPQRYENVDGTTEMSFGLMIFAMTLMGYLTPIAEKNAILPRGVAGYLLVLVGTLLPFILFGTVLTRTIKRHITYPRTGYVAYRRITGENRWRTVFFAVALSVAAANPGRSGATHSTKPRIKYGPRPDDFWLFGAIRIFRFKYQQRTPLETVHDFRNGNRPTHNRFPGPWGYRTVISPSNGVQRVGVARVRRSDSGSLYPEYSRARCR